MQGTSYVFVGEISENGSLIEQGPLAVYATDCAITVHKHVDVMFRGKTLSVQPFHPMMFWGGAVERGYQISMQGSMLGSYTNGPLGHPGDGEFEIFDVLKASISGTYRKEGLDIDIEVSTGRGDEVCHFAKEEKKDVLDPLNVTAKFFVPKDILKDFLGFNDSNFKYFLDRLNAIA
jgi:hypothetical protein